jgi:hypothetical protein
VPFNIAFSLGNEYTKDGIGFGTGITLRLKIKTTIQTNAVMPATILKTILSVI